MIAQLPPDYVVEIAHTKTSFRQSKLEHTSTESRYDRLRDVRHRQQAAAERTDFAPAVDENANVIDASHRKVAGFSGRQHASCAHPRVHYLWLVDRALAPSDALPRAALTAAKPARWTALDKRPASLVECT